MLAKNPPVYLVYLNGDLYEQVESASLGSHLDGGNS